MGMRVFWGAPSKLDSFFVEDYVQLEITAR
jgi:hypothetical protein